MGTLCTMCTLHWAVSSEAAVLQLISSDANAAEKFTRVFIVAQSLSSSWVQFAFCPSCLFSPLLLAPQTALHPSIHPLTALRCYIWDGVFRKPSPSQQLVWSSSSHRNWRPIYVGSWNLQLMRRSSHRSLSLPPIAVCNTCALSPIVDVPDQQCAGEEVTCFL